MIYLKIGLTLVVFIATIFFSFRAGLYKEKKKIKPGLYENMGTMSLERVDAVVTLKNNSGKINTYIVKGNKIPPKGTFRVGQGGEYIETEK